MAERIRRCAVTVAALLAAVTVAGCGSSGGDGGGVGDALADASDRLAEVRSGELALTVTATGSEPNAVTGFEVIGPFALPDEGELARADLEYVRVMGDRRVPVRFVSTGEAAFVLTGGSACEVDQASLRGLRGADAEAPTFDLALDEWFTEPHQPDPRTIEGEVAAERVLPALFDLARGLGAEAPEIDDETADALRKVTESATGEVTLDDDGWVTGLVVDMRFAAADDANLPDEVAALARAGLRLELGLSEINDDVVITPPDAAEPCRA